MIFRSLQKKAGIAILVSFAYSTIIFPAYAATGRLSPQSFSQMYNLAAKGDVVSLKAAIHRGLNLDTPNENGDTALCVAVQNRNAKAYNTLMAAGANPRPACSWKISYWHNFTQSGAVKSGALWQNSSYTRPVYGIATDNSNTWAWVGGGLLLAGGAALALSGGGGGGGSGGESSGGLTCEFGCKTHDSDGKCIECNDSSGSSCEENPCGDGCFTNITCGSGETCTQTNSCGGCEKCESAIISKENFVISTETALHNSSNISQTGTDRTETWGGIYTKNQTVDNQGDITLSDGSNGVGILSCLYQDIDKCLNEVMDVSGGSVTNYGNIIVSSDKSYGILAANLGYIGKEEAYNNVLKSDGKITVSGADSTGVALIGGGDVQVSGTIMMNGNMTVDEDYPRPSHGTIQLHPENSAVYVDIKTKGAAPDVTNSITNDAQIILAPTSAATDNGKYKIASGIAVRLNDHTQTQQINIKNAGNMELDSRNASTDSLLIGLAAVDYNPGDEKKISILNTGNINIKDQGMAMYVDGVQLENKGQIDALDGGDGITALNSIINQYGNINTTYYLNGNTYRAFNLYNSTVNIIQGATINGDIYAASDSLYSSPIKSYINNDGNFNSLNSELRNGEFNNLLNGQASICGLQADKISNSGKITGNLQADFYQNEIYIWNYYNVNSAFNNNRTGVIESSKLGIGMKQPNKTTDLYNQYFNLFVNEGRITTDVLTISANLFTNTGSITTGTLKYVGHGENGNNVDLTGINFLPQEKLISYNVSLASVNSDHFKLADIDISNDKTELSTEDLLGRDSTASGILVENVMAQHGDPTAEVGMSALEVNNISIAFNPDAVLEGYAADTINGIKIDRKLFDTTLNGNLTLVFSHNVNGVNISGDNSSFINNKEMNVKGKYNVAGILAFGNEVSVENNGKINVENLSIDQTEPNKVYATYGIYGNNAAVTTSKDSVINIYSSMPGENTYGIFMTGASSGKNEGNIVVQAPENASGVKAAQTTNAGFENAGTIEVNSLGGTGMFASGYVDGTSTNNRYASLLNSGAIIMYAQGSSGMTANGYKSYVRNTGSIALSNGQSVGMYAVNGGLASNRGTIDLGTDKANNIGMYGTDATIYNEGDDANIQGSAAQGSLIGIYLSGESTGANKALINLNANNSVGIYAAQTKGTFENSGTITLTGENNIGMWADGLSETGVEGDNDREVTLLNSGTITVNGTNAIGMLASGSKSTIINNGTINVGSGEPMVAEDGGIIGTPPATQAFAISNGATFVNKGILTANGTMDLDHWRDELSMIVAGRNSQFKADALSGTLAAGSDITTGSNEDKYTAANVLQGDNIDVNLQSNSAMFEAGLQNNNQDIVMFRKSFDDLLDNKALSVFLEENYKQGNRVDLFDFLKSASNTTQLSAIAGRQLGAGLLPTLSYQNMQRAKYFNRTMEDLIIDNSNKKEERISVVSNNYYESHKTHKGFSGYEDRIFGVSALFDKALSPELRYGVGFGLYRTTTDFDGNDTRRDVIVQVYNPYHYENRAWGAVIMPYAGYSHGEYKRFADGKKFNPDVDVWYYGLSNRAYLKTTYANIALEPTAEMNLNGAYQDQVSEDNGIRTESQNTFSAEAGIGAYASKQADWGEKGRLKIRAGAMYYYELNPDAYDTIKSQMYGMDGSYRLSGYDNRRSRGIISLRGDYAFKGWNLYAEIIRLLEHDDNMVYNAGLRFSF